MLSCLPCTVLTYALVMLCTTAAVYCDVFICGQATEMCTQYYTHIRIVLYHTPLSYVTGGTGGMSYSTQ